MVSLTLSWEQDSDLFSYPPFRDCVKVVFLLPTAAMQHRDIATTVLSHNTTSVLGRSKELCREDPEQEALGKHLQDDSGSDNPRMFCLEQMVLCLPSVWFRQSSEGNHPLKMICTLWSGQILSHIFQSRGPERPMEKGN